MRKKVDIALLIVVFIVGFFAVSNAQAIGDWWHLQRYEPSAEVAHIAEQSGMNETGKAYFFRFSPELVDVNEIASKCGGGEHRIGCVEGMNMYIVRGTTEQSKHEEVVTGAHEMLHVAYSRLTNEEIQRINNLLDEQLAKPDGEKVLKKLQDYSQEDFYSEAHSYVGTEIEDLSVELEQHYQKYFSDRQKTLTAFTKSL